MNYNNNKWSK